MKKIAVGILAHVDAGKTTLNECFAYQGKLIRKMGRVDHADSYFDYDKQEKERGITIYSKIATFNYNDAQITLVDTPGHVDFSPEMERTLSILDVAIVVISGLSGVQSHTRTIFNLLREYHIPYFVFVNKMDITSYSEEELLKDLRKNEKSSFVDFGKKDESFYERIAENDEELLNEYLQNQTLSTESIQMAIAEQKIIPLYFGSALKNINTESLLDDLVYYNKEKQYPEEFGMKLFKIAYDQQLTRLCYVKITGGTLNAKEKLDEEEKIDQIRLYTADHFTLLNQATAGDIVALKGLNGYVAGQGFGIEETSEKPRLNAFMNYRVLLPRGTDDHKMMEQLQMLQQQDPSINVSYDEALKEIHLSIMGEIQIEVIKRLIKERTGVDIQLDNGKILFKETIVEPVVGIGHFEPLRHYAEVHVLLEPLARNEGLVFDSKVSTDELALNWQRLILTHLKEKVHRGVLTGSPLTDCKITLVAGKAHLKHTEGGDFRQATYRAVRQGLKKGQSILLEPYFSFVITLNNQYLSKVLYDLEQMKAKVEVGALDETLVSITGSAPVRLMQNYQTTLSSLTSGSGTISMEMSGYQKCEDAAEIIEHIGYDSELDLHNPTGSVFCSGGSGVYIPYNQVDEYAHIQQRETVESPSTSFNRNAISNEELNRVVSQINGRNYKEKKHVKTENTIKMKPSRVDHKQKYLIVDGYNMMFGWNKTKEIARSSFDNARDIVINQLSSYAGYRKMKVTVVFDAYKVQEGIAHKINNGPLEIIYTSANQTADSYIEKLVHDSIDDYFVTVASSDFAVQNVIFAQGASRMSARELENEIEFLNSGLMK